MDASRDYGRIQGLLAVAGSPPCQHERSGERPPSQRSPVPQALAARLAVIPVVAGRQWLEGQGTGVDAVTRAGGSGPIAEDMAQMAAAAAAEHLGAAQEPALVRPQFDRFCDCWLGAARPAR